MDQPDIIDLLKRIKAFYEKTAPSFLALSDSVIEPATEAELAEFEQELGFPLPDNYRKLLLHNDFAILFKGNYRLMNLSRVRYQWAMMKDLVENKHYNDAANSGKYDSNWYSGDMKPMLWNTSWIPFALDSGGNKQCLDLDPGEEGSKGQIVTSDVSEGSFMQGCFSLMQYLKRHLSALEEGDYDLVDEGDGVMFVYMR